jgi:hypothetical protein
MLTERCGNSSGQDVVQMEAYNEIIQDTMD